MTNLEELDARGDCGISDEDLKGLNLKKLNAHGNSKIKQISHMNLAFTV